MRITDKRFSFLPPKNIAKWKQNYYINIEKKLRKLEDNEEELGIDLNTIVNLGTFYAKGDDGNIYEVHMGTTKYNNGEIVEKYIDFKNLCIHAAYFWGGTYMADKNLYFKDYGITWALTREELE